MTIIKFWTQKGMIMKINTNLSPPLGVRAKL